MLGHKFQKYKAYVTQLLLHYTLLHKRVSHWPRDLNVKGHRGSAIFLNNDKTKCILSVGGVIR